MDTKASKYTNETFALYAKALIGGFNTLIATYKIIADVGKKLNGKVFNRRFETLIEKQCEDAKIGVFVSLDDQDNAGDKFKKLMILLQNPTIKSGDIWISFADDLVYYNFIYNCNACFVNNDGKVIGQRVVETCEEKIAKCKEQINIWQDAADNYNKYNNQINDAVKQFGKAVKEINPLFKPGLLSHFDWEQDSPSRFD